MSDDERVVDGRGKVDLGEYGKRYWWWGKWIPERERGGNLRDGIGLEGKWKLMGWK